MVQRRCDLPSVSPLLGEGRQAVSIGGSEKEFQKAGEPQPPPPMCVCSGSCLRGGIRWQAVQ